jgi:elongation factor G
VVNLLSLPEPAPASPVNLTAARSQLIDAVVEVDEALTEKYLLEGEVTPEELSAALPQALAAGTVVPIFCTSSKKGVGLQELLDGLIAHALSPAEGKKRVAKQGQGEETSAVILEPNPEGPAVAGAFRSMTDRFVGTLSYLRIFSGTFKSDQPLFNARTGKSARTGGLFEVQGSKTEAISEAGPGDIVAVTKVDDLLVGDTAHVQADAPVLPTPVFPAPMYGLAVEPKARGDEQKISGSLTKVSNEDPTFRVTREAQTRELVITGMSQLHLDVIQSRLKRRFDLDIITHDPKIPYRETITTEAAADHRHKKQSGGRGQFGEVHLRLYPLPGDITSEEQFFEQFANKTRFEKIRVDNCDYDPEHNFGFIDTIVGGTIPNQYVPAVAKGCREVMSSGALAGYRIQGVAAEVHFGKDHPVDSSEAAFKTAGRMAFKKAFQAANPVILEPIVDLEVTIPSKYVGSILGDLNTKRARIEDQDSLPGDLTVLKAKAPLAEVMRYAAQLGSITQGSGSYAMEFSHYEQVPGNVQQQIVSKAKLAEEEED